MKITTQKLHKIIQGEIKTLSSKYAPSQKVDRTTYDLLAFKGFIGVCSSQYINQICKALDDAGVLYDDRGLSKQFVRVPVMQTKAHLDALLSLSI